MQELGGAALALSILLSAPEFDSWAQDLPGREFGCLFIVLMGQSTQENRERKV